MSNIFEKPGRYWHTIRYLRPAQIINRILRRFKRINIDLSPASETRKKKSEWVKPPMREPRMLGESEFFFLNESHIILQKSDWNNEKNSKLWLYNLHYFDDLNATLANQRYDWHCSYLKRWIMENPVGFGNGWEPYPSSLRIVNWIKWGLAGNGTEDEWLHSLTLQIRYLSKNLETHLLGNHLFANAKALMFAGLFFTGREANVWYETALRIIKVELPEQVLNDGGNFELSTMYHEIFLEDLLDIVNMHRTMGMAIPAEIEEYIPNMMYWLSAMCHPDGEISFFNDAAIGIAPSVSELFAYASRLDFEFSKPDKGLTELPDSGYSRIETDDAVVLIDQAAIGPDYLPGHAHADTLSFEMSIFQKRVIINSGTSVYGTSIDRQQERSTATHSTVVLDGENSSEVWGGFRVARRARVFNKENKENSGVIVSACHDGFKRLSGNPVHCRTWDFSNSSLVIHDKISGYGSHKAEVIFHFHPEVVLDKIHGDGVTLLVEGNLIDITCVGDGKLRVEPSTYHPEFGLSIDNKKLVYSVKFNLSTEVETKISWREI